MSCLVSFLNLVCWVLMFSCCHWKSYWQPEVPCLCQHCWTENLILILTVKFPEASRGSCRLSCSEACRHRAVRYDLITAKVRKNGYSEKIGEEIQRMKRGWREGVWAGILVGVLPSQRKTHTCTHTQTGRAQQCSWMASLYTRQACWWSSEGESFLKAPSSRTCTHTPGTEEDWIA